MPSTYRADVDGLRAIAVLPVILFHAELPQFGGGFIGVDIFFVISGFVIALSLNRDLEAGRFSLSGFYERRARRILPAFTVVMAATFVAALVLVPPVFFDPFAKSLVYAALFLSNLYFWKNSGYFVDDTFHPLRHTWSLGVEEQYYIVAPMLLFLVFRYFGRRWTLSLAPLLLASLALSVAITSTHPNANFFSLATRTWELLAGALLALAPPPQISSRVTREALALLGLALIAVPVFSYTNATPFPGLAAVPPCLGAVLLIHVGGASKPSAVGKFLSWRPMVLVGLISYSLYLVHWPLLVIVPFALMRDLAPLDIALVVAASFVLAGLLYVFVEVPLRHMRGPRPMVFGAALAAVGGAAFAGLAGPAFNLRFHRELVASYPGATQVDYDTHTSRWKVHDCVLDLSVDRSKIGDWSFDTCAYTNGAGGDILLWGDSFAAHYAAGLESERQLIGGRVGLYAAYDCRPERNVSPQCEEFNRRALDIIDRNHIRRVVIAGAWSKRSPDQIDGVLAELKRRGVETVLIGASPVFFMDPVLMGARDGLPLPADARVPPVPQLVQTNARLAARANETGARFIDPMMHLCGSEGCFYRRGSVNYYFDHAHFTPPGSAFAVRTYFPFADESRAAIHSYR